MKENIRPDQNPAEKIKECLNNYYSGDLVALHLQLAGGGIEGVRRMMREGYKVPTVEEFFKREGYAKMLTDAVRQNPEFIKKSAELDELASRINALGENIDEGAVRETLKRAKEIVGR